MKKGARALSGISFVRTLILFIREYFVVTSQRPHFQMPSHWGLGFNIWILGGHKYSFCRRYWICQMLFPALIEMIMWFLTPVLLIWYITLIDTCVLNCLCIPGINLTWSWCMILPVYCWIGLLIVCWKISHLCSSGILACNFFFLYHPCLVLVSG